MYCGKERKAPLYKLQDLVTKLIMCIHVQCKGVMYNIIPSELCINFHTLQLKAYARARGVPNTWNEKDKAHVVLKFHQSIVDLDGENLQHYFRIVLLILYIALNIQVAALLVRFIPQYYPLAMQKLLEGTNPQVKEKLSSIYWAVVFVVGGYNTLNVIVSLLYSTYTFWSGIHAQQPSDPFHSFTDEKAIFIAKVILAPTFMAVKLLVAVCTTKHSDTNFTVPHKIVGILCCCYCCSTKLQSKVVQTIFLWHTMIFIQNVASTVLPIGIFLFVNPQRTISMLLFLTTLLLSIVVVLAHLFQVCHSGRGNRCKCTKGPLKRCGVIGVEQIAILSFFVFVWALFLVYIVITWYGTAPGGIEELAIPFVSVLVDILISWHVKRTFFENGDTRKKATRRIPCQYQEIEEEEETGNDEEIPLLPVGKD